MTNNILSTAQQVYLRQLGGAQPVVDKDGGGIISAGQAKRSSLPSATTATASEVAKDRRGERSIIPDYLLVYSLLSHFSRWELG